MPNEHTKALILAILRESHSLGRGPLLSTVLHKLVYLCDVYTAEEKQGETFTGETWRFMHFGPFAAGVSQTIERLAGEGSILLEQRQHSTADAEFKLFSYRRGLGNSLRDVVGSSVALRLHTDIQRFNDLRALLDYVYFKTEPMADARPGSVLRFNDCKKLDYASFKPVVMKTIPAKTLEAARARLRKIASAEQSACAIGPYDEAYFRALGELDEQDSLSEGLSGSAQIKLD